MKNDGRRSYHHTFDILLGKGILWKWKDLGTSYNHVFLFIRLGIGVHWKVKYILAIIILFAYVWAKKVYAQMKGISSLIIL